ncbi:MAG TPA: sigma-70 family RNA polymerase sigma factor [Drouetiella sp.]|jgi:RNA polymerase sigma-70 factor, ECF subfamily
MYQNSHTQQLLNVVSKVSVIDELSDPELIVLAQQRDERAFGVLVKRHQASIRAHLYQLAPDSADRADFEQEVLIRMWRCIGALRNCASFKSWLRQIGTNIFYDSLRKKPALKVVSLDESFANERDENVTRDVEDTSALPEEMLQRSELMSEIESALAKLPEPFRVAMILREMHGLSYDEIATLTKSEKGTVKSRISRARDKVQASMAPYFKDCA